jgi:hypothetical protein
LEDSKGITNSAGNLCLHLVGNLNTYIGNTYGNSNYVRNRELEFSLKDIPRSELIHQIEQTILVEHALDNPSEKELLMDFPFLVLKNNFNRVHVDSSHYSPDLSPWPNKLPQTTIRGINKFC